jgi:hypothetical protein
MAKRIECPNCGAPATEQTGKVQFTCGYCGSVADVTDGGLRKAGLALGSSADVPAAVMGFGDAVLKATTRTVSA